MSENETAIEKQDDVMSAMIDIFEQQLKLVGDTDREFCNWYLQTLAEADASDALLVKMQAQIKKQIAARRKSLQDRYGMEFRVKIQALIDKQPGKNKSIIIDQGKAGERRTQKSVEINDVQKAVKWLYRHGWTKELLAAMNSIKLTSSAKNATFATMSESSFCEIVGGLNKTPLLDLITSIGVEIDGVELIEPHNQFFPWDTNCSVLMPTEPKPQIEGSNDVSR